MSDAADKPGRRITIRDLKPISRIPEPAQMETPRRPTPRPLKPPAPRRADWGSTAPWDEKKAKPGKPPKPVAKVKQPKVETPAPPTLLPAAAYVPTTVHRDGDGFPCGWCFERQSWGFHRALWHEHGIRLDVGDYTWIIRQGLGGTAEGLARDIWRVELRASGRMIIVGVRAGVPVTVLPDEGWEAFRPWVAGLVEHMHDPEPVPRPPRARRPRTPRSKRNGSATSTPGRPARRPRRRRRRQASPDRRQRRVSDADRSGVSQNRVFRAPRGGRRDGETARVRHRLEN
jgi:hypothetical protein